jgi:hypothetical protein
VKTIILEFTNVFIPRGMAIDALSVKTIILEFTNVIVSCPFRREVIGIRPKAIIPNLDFISRARR